VRALTCQRFVDDGYEIQLGRVAKRVYPDRVDKWLIDTRAEFDERLRSTFSLAVADIAPLWQRVAETHEKLFAHSETAGT